MSTKAKTGSELIEATAGADIAGRLLRSPSGLAPQPVGAIDQLGVGLGLRRHDAPPFRSCLHSGSDTPPAARRVRKLRRLRIRG
jgi:hypothetical protein